MLRHNDPRTEIAEEVREALAMGRPVVALESTLIAHGLPWPDNRETALDAERAVREAGATLATIAVIDGRIRVGLSADEIERLAASAASPTEATSEWEINRDKSRSKPPTTIAIAKASRRDLAAVIASGRSAATTVSATLWIARSLGLTPGIMATGGLGGVHRDAARTFDISTDLDELARADGFLLVSAGFKSILDLPATLEMLETLGVLLVGYQTNDLPGFTTTKTGLPLEHRVDSRAEAAALVAAQRELGLPGAIVLAQPPPQSEAVAADEMNRALEQAIAAADAEGVRGKALTPFLLDHVRQATEGTSLRSNRALIVANARLAAEIAVKLAAMESTPNRSA
jgi:pseudouridine-5'-phosphate glycosidase